jgi:hypothetical protein
MRGADRVPPFGGSISPSMVRLAPLLAIDEIHAPPLVQCILLTEASTFSIAGCSLVPENHGSIVRVARTSTSHIAAGDPLLYINAP